MKRQIRKLLLIGGLAVMINWPLAVRAESPIHAVVDSKGKIVFTNGLETHKPVVAEPVEDPAAANTIPGMIRAVSARHGVDADLVAAVVKVESNFDHRARSPKGALGLMQLIPETGARFGVRNFFDPRENLDGGVRYLKSLLEMFDGNVDLSLAAYNAGENLVKRVGRIPAIPETRDYVRKIRSIYKKSVAPVLEGQEDEFKVESVSESVPADTGVIFRKVDDRGVVSISNIAPPN
jgi:soluble lytic murein transglycosylase-like protein